MFKNKKKITILEDVLTVIEKWSKDNDVCFFGSFVSFDEEKIKADADDIIKEDRMICFGDRKSLKIALDGFLKEFKKEKDDSVNW